MYVRSYAICANENRGSFFAQFSSVEFLGFFNQRFIWHQFEELLLKSEFTQFDYNKFDCKSVIPKELLTGLFL